MVKNQARPLELDLLCQKLDMDFGSRITGIGNNKRSNFLSKAIAAFVLNQKAGASLDDAIAASIDGGFDHGIDSVFIAADQTIWLVQSKYKDTGVGEPELGEISKFRDGITDLLHGHFNRFNEALRNQEAALKNALNSETCRVYVVLAYTGTAISDDRRHIFCELERAFNSTNPGFLCCVSYGLTALHSMHIDSAAQPDIEAEVLLRDFGYTQQPYKAFYGRIEARQLAELWDIHQDRLVEKNIRRFKGATSVNAGLTQTLQSEPEHFFYFNNGVTFLCNSIHEVHPRDTCRQTGRFRVRGMSIINGAQTVGAIARETVSHYDEHPVEVLATFVCLENAEDSFGDRVTQARNRQNAVDLEDFAALDERQENWSQTLKMQGVDYLIKEGEGDALPSETCFSIREAAPILACTVTAGDWPEFVVAAKSDQKRLFGLPGLVPSNGSLSDAYNRLFADSCTARQIWRAVQIGRKVLSSIKGRARTEADPAGLPSETVTAREILRHGGWLVLHVLFLRTQLHHGATLSLSQNDLHKISIEVDLIASHLVSVVQGAQWGKHARSIFANRTDCMTVKNHLMAALAQQQ
ncbi:MAG: AIPR family protein [Azovibrio sp.]